MTRQAFEHSGGDKCQGSPGSELELAVSDGVQAESQIQHTLRVGQSGPLGLHLNADRLRQNVLQCALDLLHLFPNYPDGLLVP